ncbi:FAD/NAD(P)-binding protein [Paracoccus sulfuroxidans]|uniref:Putative NAD(P)/FAD-binding protein YdhS n=1 Tax=Paracoccus sulfuroxidans TaxID=384678 RepID=A0A562NUL8_9RHOB|nr:FAD/NAD(P)-binding protein [Paracoccus sulfuroxidans]TWI35781.1 putative NAD(P)/FAD-binding protein YdhS [Paracoccus sulfuroxidans]
MTIHPPVRPRIVIVGGGFTGGSLAWQLARMQVPATIIVIEPREELGRGLAYSTQDPAHRLNVPAHRISLDPNRPEGFAEWLSSAQDNGWIADDPELLTADGERFPRREVFGQYVAHSLAPLLDSGRIRHIRQRAVDAELEEDGSVLVHLSDDSTLRAEVLVLATGHPAPAVPPALRGLTGNKRLVEDVYAPDRLAQVQGDARVLVLGAALTSADAISTLEAQGFRGQIRCLSRHGLRSRGHRVIGRESREDFTDPAIRRPSELLRRIRHAITDDLAQGQSWHATMSRLRQQGAQIWAQLDEAGRQTLLRHARTFWDVHRYRLAPQAEAVIDRLVEAGRLEYLAGHLISAEAREDGISVSWRVRGSRAVQTEHFDHVIVTTGPAQGRCIEQSPFLGALARLGQITPDPLGLGLATTGGHHAMDASGRENARIMIAGPLARGHVGELVGAPECASHARNLAQDVARQLSLAPFFRILGPGASVAQRA